MVTYYQKDDKTEFFRMPNWIVKKCYEMISNEKEKLTKGEKWKICETYNE